MFRRLFKFRVKILIKPKIVDIVPVKVARCSSELQQIQFTVLCQVWMKNVRK